MPVALVISLVYVAGAAMAAAAAAVFWRRRGAPGATPLAWLLASASFWAAGDAIELHMATEAGRRLVSQVQYLGIVSASPFYFHAAVALAGRSFPLTPLRLILVWGVPLVSLLMVWTSGYHQWLWTRVDLPSGDLPFATYYYGWWFWVLTAQHYLLMLTATTLLLRAARMVRPEFRRAMMLVVVAALLPWAGHLAYILKLGPWPGLNWLTLSLVVSGWLFVRGVVRDGLFDLVPTARQALIDLMEDGVLVLDRAGRVIFSNREARGTLGLDPSAVAATLGLPSLTACPVDWRGEGLFPSRRGPRWLDVRLSPVLDRWGAIEGRIVVARDVTTQKELEDERERLVDELRDALQRVTQLEGLLPICASCRNVRDDRGHWRSLEQYLGSRTPVEFTHGICPDCMQTLYAGHGLGTDRGGDAGGA